MSVTELQGNWNYPTTIRFGVGRINELSDVCATLGMSYPLLVTDAGLIKLSLVADIVENCESNGMRVSVFSDVKSNPSGNNIKMGVLAYNAGGHDGVIALGGGSALDAAKAIALMVGQTRSLWDFEDVGDNWMRVDIDGMVPVIAIPTTSGTGSEVGRASVIVDESIPLKKIIFHPKMLPELVIADPQLTVGLPPQMTAATGMDALVHNLEAYCAPAYHPMADGIAVEAIKLVKNWIFQAYSHGDDLVARSHMMSASMMGATAFQKGLGGVHALAHPLGAVYDAHHGLLNAILLPYVLVRNRDAIEQKVADLAYLLSLQNSTFDGFIDWIVELRAQLNIQHDLSSIVGDESRVAEVARLATEDAASAGNPLFLSAEDYSQVLTNAIRGDL